MSKMSERPQKTHRSTIAVVVICLSFLILGMIIGLTVVFDKENAYNIFNIVLPLLATWVGAVIAFYFGKENFESANTEVREMVKLTYTDKAKKPVLDIMNKIAGVRAFHLEGKSEDEITLDDILKVYGEGEGGAVTRLPILYADRSPKYMIHKSSIYQYLLEHKGTESRDDTLSDFITAQRLNGQEFGLNTGFVVVSENTTIEEAKVKMESVGSACQDIFVTKNGVEKEALTGWISNIRLSRYLKA